MPLTSNLKWATAPGNVELSSKHTGLPKDSIALVSQLATLDKSELEDRCGKIPRSMMNLVLRGIDIIFDR